MVKSRANWIGQIWLRNCLLNDVIEGMKGRNDGKTMKKTPSATGTPQGKEKIL
jgi:hypothetical protein